ncbi:MAG TPA: cation:proton antiporter [Chloroflexaceae bacterium]|nr:cation:proton antiporter [Chloroflexaceae bacterium]
MSVWLWFLIVGAVFVLMALASSTLRRLPLSTSLLYLLIGVAIGPVGLGLLRLDPLDDAKLLEHLTEVAVVISLFTSGLKLRARLRDPAWREPLRLAFGAMALTVGLIALVAVAGLGLSLGAAVLLGAILAPTDPVLASDVQVKRPTDTDRLRFSLTGEAGLNDGTAFPFVMLGLGLLGLHELGAGGWRWVAVDLLWATAAGLGVGWLLGQLVGRLVVYLRREHHEALGLDDFLALGLIGLSYGAALLIHAYGFLAVFAAGLALRHLEIEASASTKAETVAAEDEAETPEDAEETPAYMAQAVLGFNEQLERIAEVAMVLLLGSMLVPLAAAAPPAVLWFVPALFLIIRPLAVSVGLLGSPLGPLQRLLTCWFSIRGIGSLYYLMFAITHGVGGDLGRQLAAIAAVTVAASIVVHGISVTPLMERYRRRVGAGDPAAVSAKQ